LVVTGLREIAARLQLGGENRFRARAYELGADAIDGLPDAELARHLAAGSLTDVPSIGRGLAAVTEELARTGKAAILERLRAAAPAALLELRQIPGLSHTRAKKLHEGLGVETLDQLEAAARGGRVRELRGFGPKTERALLAAIESYRSRPAAIRLIDAQDVAAALVDFTSRQAGVRDVEITGAVRRWEEIIDEISVVVAVAGDKQPVMEAVAAYPRLARVETRGNDCLIGRLADGTRVRIRLTQEAGRGWALIEETGPTAHVDALMARAQARDLDPRSLRESGESGLYGRLDLPTIPPEARAWPQLPTADALAALVSEADILGAVHCHTTESDGRHTLEEMARAADARGLRYMTITDHSPTASYAGGLTVDRLRRQWEQIARVQETVKVRLLRGTESDILADGSLDYPDAILAQLDVVVASIHGRYRMDAKAMTERLLRAMRLPVFKIWGHALGRLVLRRDPIACDVEAVLDGVAGSRAAIEISGDPYRLDLPPAWIPAARRRGIRFVISTDAHSVSDLDNLAYGLAMARRGGVRRDEVLNTLPVGAFRAAVKP
jgi:DNA polymerase (family 10)